MQPVFEVKKFNDIKHLLPAGSWWIKHRRHEDMSNEYAAFYEGNAVTENINLDFFNLDISLNDESLRESIGLIVITGNLRAKNIMNAETDGAVSLIVLGNLEADNIAVGGQEIYVCGDLLVHDLYWGDYNHGELQAEGHVAARVFMATDEYHFDWKRFLRKENVDIALLANDDDANGDISREVMESAFEEACLVDEAEADEIYSFKDWLDAAEINRRLGANEPVLRGEIAAREEETIPYVFEGDFLTDNNMERFRTSFLFSLFGSSESALKKIEFWREDTFTRVTVQQDKPLSTNLYFQHKEEYAIMVFCFEYENSLRRAITYKSLTGDDQEWHSLDLQHPQPHLRSLLETGYKNLLKEFSAMEFYQQKYREEVTLEKARTIMALPLVKQKYSGYYNDDAEVLYIGNLMIEFRQEDPATERAPRIGIIQSIPHAEEEDDRFAFFHFDILRDEAGNERVTLRTQDADGYDSTVYNVSVTDTGKFKKALEFFALLEKKIFPLNEKYLAELNANRENE